MTNTEIIAAFGHFTQKAFIYNFNINWMKWYKELKKHSISYNY